MISFRVVRSWTSSSSSITTTTVVYDISQSSFFLLLIMRFPLLAAALLATIHAAPLNDLVETLPDYGRPPSTMFSGYLDASPGCDVATNGPICKIHYWMAMATVEDPQSAPVVLWLNGGPGSSSILGFLQENGPLLINATGGLMDNPWSWTKVANLLVIEAPIGVGYSYCSRQLEEGQPCVNTDKYTAKASAAALVDFFGTKFPELADNPFFITGESYAGVYIPTLAQQLLNHAPEINLQGIAVGDPCTDNTAQQDSMDALWYGHKNGLVDDAIFDQLWNQCGYRVPTVWAKGGPHLYAAHMNARLEQETTTATTRRQLAQPWFLRKQPYHDDPACTVAYRKFLLSTSHALSQSWRDLYIDDYSLFAPVTFQQDEDMANYMRRNDVRKALHVEEAPVTTWPYADMGFDYTKEYNACNDEAPADAPSMIDIYREIVPQLQITWIYNGDTDPCVSYEGTRTAVKRIGFTELDGGGYRPWFYRQKKTSLAVLAEKAPLFGPFLLAQSVGPQMGGEVVNYEHGLSFVTFAGAGHMVPQFRPQSSLHFLRKLLSFQPLSPPLPSNATLAELSDEDFESATDQWTEEAKSSPYVAE